jgi:outer membrane lipopolysaccharide assembly protein LptE/RlpB
LRYLLLLPPQFSQAFHDYLVNHVEIQTIELKELGSANKGLTGDNNFLTGTNKEISALNEDIARQLRASNKQVDRLKGKLTRKVTQFELLLLGKQVEKQSLLDDMNAKKAQVASLQMDLQALNLARIPAR